MNRLQQHKDSLVEVASGFRFQVLGFSVKGSQRPSQSHMSRKLKDAEGPYRARASPESQRFSTTLNYPPLRLSVRYI